MTEGFRSLRLENVDLLLQSHPEKVWERIQEIALPSDQTVEELQTLGWNSVFSFRSHEYSGTFKIDDLRQIWEVLGKNYTFSMPRDEQISDLCLAREDDLNELEKDRIWTLMKKRRPNFT